MAYPGAGSCRRMPCQTGISGGASSRRGGLSGPLLGKIGVKIRGQHPVAGCPAKEPQFFSPVAKPPWRGQADRCAEGARQAEDLNRRDYAGGALAALHVTE